MPVVNMISVRFVLCYNITRVNATKNPSDSLMKQNMGILLCLLR